MHVSISGGMDRMAERARDYGCEAVQIFSRSPRGGKARALSAEEVAGARSVLEAADVRPLVVHTPYFANLVAGDKDLRRYAVETVAEDLHRASELGSPYVVTHVGRPAPDLHPEAARELAAESLSSVLRAQGGTGGVILLLENTAGSEREMGASLEDLAGLLGRVEAGFPGRLGVCLDTCHAHAAGYDLSRPASVRRFIDLALELFGPERVRVVHANDSLAAAGSRLDRHAPVGAGTIGESGFRALLGDPRLRGCPFLVETPGTDEERARDLERLRRLRQAAGGGETASGEETGR